MDFRDSFTPAICALLFSSCAMIDLPRVARRVPFNEAEFAAYRGTGSSTVSGQVVVKSSDGQTHPGGNTEISLLPVTAYTKEMVEREIGNGEYLTASDPRLQPYLHVQRMDDSGHFSFDHVKAGEYFIAALVEWSFADDTTYQWACERITVGAGQTMRIKVSKNLQHQGKPTLVLAGLQ